MVAKPIQYFNKWGIVLIIFSVALLFAHVDVLESGFVLPSDYRFPFSAFAINAFYIALALFCFHALVEYLDGKKPWSESVRSRFFTQLTISFAIYLLLQILIIYYIEPIFNQYSGTPIRIGITFLIGFLVVVFVNLVYLFAYLKYQAETTTKEMNPAEFLQGTFRGKKMIMPIVNFMAFQIEEGVVFGINQEQKKIILKESLTDLEKLLDKDQYFRINRKQIVAKKAIRKVEYETEGASEILSDFLTDEFLISRRRTPSFRKWIYSKG